MENKTVNGMNIVTFKYMEKKFNNQKIQTIFSILLFIAVMFGLVFSMSSGIDKSIQNQDTMLCESAKISRNVQWLHKCECYYEGEDIKCLQK